MYDQLKNPVEQAEEFFQTAQEELYKPEEDVVRYMVCKSAFNAVLKYLTAYLQERSIPIGQEETLESILELCRKDDPKFNNLALELLYNAHEEEDVWMDMATAQEFMDLAIATRKMVGLG